MTIEFWPEVDHLEMDQLKRQKSATEKKTQTVSISKENQSGVFQGSHGEYQTTLSSCTCMDFFVRRRPCKHIYRLAKECDVFDFDANVALYEKTMKIRKEINALLDTLHFESLEAVFHVLSTAMNAEDVSSDE